MNAFLLPPGPTGPRSASTPPVPAVGVAICVHVRAPRDQWCGEAAAPKGPYTPYGRGYLPLPKHPLCASTEGGGRGCLGLSHTKKGRLRRGACPRKFAIHGKWAPFLYPPSSRPRGGTRRVGFMLHRHVFPTQEVRLHLSTRRVSCSRLLPGGGGGVPFPGRVYIS